MANMSLALSDETVHAGAIPGEYGQLPLHSKGGSSGSFYQ